MVAISHSQQGKSFKKVKLPKLLNKKIVRRRLQERSGMCPRVLIDKKASITALIRGAIEIIIEQDEKRVLSSHKRPFMRKTN